MARPIDPDSLSTRIRVALAEDKPLAAYVAPPDTAQDQVHYLLAVQMDTLRMLLSRARLKCRASATRNGVDYNEWFPGDRDGSASIWIDTDARTCFIGRNPAHQGMRRLSSIDARFTLKPGESAICRLFHRGERDTRIWLSEMSSKHHHQSGTFPVFDASLLRVDGDLRHADYIITRHADSPHNLFRASLVQGATEALKEAKARHDATNEARAAKKAASEAKAAAKAAAREAKITAERDAKAAAKAERTSDRVIKQAWTIRCSLTGSDPKKPMPEGWPGSAERLQPFLDAGSNKEALKRAILADIQAQKKVT